MKKHCAILATATSLLLAGCSYKVPLTTEHTIPIDPALIGFWEDAESGNTQSCPHPEGILVLPFSETEYMISYLHKEMDGSPLFFRGYPVELGNISCVQLQLIGGYETDPSSPMKEEDKCFDVVKYEIKNHNLEVSRLNDNVVSGDLETSEALREAFLDNIENEALFKETGRFHRRKEVRDEVRLRLEPVVDLSDTNLTALSHANPTVPEIAVITKDGGVAIYDFAGQIVQTLKREGQDVTAVSYSPDGKQLLAGTETGGLLIWDFTSKAWKTVAEGVAGTIGRVSWLGSDKVVWGTGVRYYGKNSQPVNRDKPAGAAIELASGKTLWTYQSFVRSDFQTLSASPDGNRLVVLDIPGKPKGIEILDGARGEACVSLVNGKGPLSACAGSHKDLVAVGYAPDGVSLWDAETGKELGKLEGHSNWVVSLAFSPDGRFLVSGSGDSTARIWSVESGEEIGRIRFPGSSTYVNSVGFSPDGKKVYALAEKGMLKIAECPAETNGDEK